MPIGNRQSAIGNRPHISAGTAVIDAALLGRLLREREPVTLDALGAALGRTPAAVAEELARLKAAGCQLETHPQRGVKLIAAGLGAWVDYLRLTLPGRPRLIELYRQTSSTQDAARRLVELYGPAADGAVAIADEQTAGRGRLGRAWVAPPGSALLFSLVRVGRQTPALSVDRLMFATSVAVALAVESAAGMPAMSIGIKWPNDLLLGQRKLAGVLVETFQHGKLSAAVVGVGLNVSWRHEQLVVSDAVLAARATSLHAAGYRVDRLHLLERILTHVHEALGADPRPMIAQWQQRSALSARRVRFLCQGRRVSGTVLDLDPREGLIVRCDDGAMVHLPAAHTSVLE